GAVERSAHASARIAPGDAIRVVRAGFFNASQEDWRMSWRNLRSMKWVGAAALLLASAPAFGAGFGIFEQGSKAMGMAGAYTAQADDPSMLWHNAGGLAFVTDSAGSLGATWIHSTKADFNGAAPYPGPGVSEEQKALSAFP